MLYSKSLLLIYSMYGSCPLPLAKGKGQLPYIEYISNKDLLYSMGNYIQYLIKIYNGK